MFILLVQIMAWTYTSINSEKNRLILLIDASRLLTMPLYKSFYLLRKNKW